MSQDESGGEGERGRGEGGRLASSKEGDSRSMLSGLASRNMNDSTLNCEPLDQTSEKSTPYTRANSLGGGDEGARATTAGQALAHTAREEGRVGRRTRSWRRSRRRRASR